MAKILILETSSEVCSTAISVDGVVVALVEAQQAPSHIALITLQIEECVQKSGITLAELDAVAVSQGPGAYTSLRVGASVAKGICYALNKPLIAIDTLLALAHANAKIQSSGAPLVPASEQCIFAPMLDARRAEVWLALYSADLQELAPAQPLILENNSFEMFILNHTKGVQFDWIVLTGNGMEKTRSGVLSEKAVYSNIVRCSATYLSELAEQYFQKADFQEVAYFEPFYMKPPNITTSSKPLF